LFFLRSKFSYKHALNVYLRSFQISRKSDEAEQIKEKIMKIISEHEEAREESEQMLVAIAATAVKIEKEKNNKEDLVEESVTWLCSLSGMIAAMYIFRDVCALTPEGAKKCFEKKLEKYVFLKPLEL
jgi:hypothetical protein